MVKPCHEKGRVSSRLSLRRGDVCFPAEGQFPESLAKLLFASHRATQPQLRGRGGTLRTKTMCWSVKGARLWLANWSGKFFSRGRGRMHGGPLVVEK